MRVARQGSRSHASPWRLREGSAGALPGQLIRPGLPVLGKDSSARAYAADIGVLALVRACAARTVGMMTAGTVWWVANGRGQGPIR
jgi:hypothetical protein